MDKVLDTWAEVTSSSPDVLNKSDLIGVNLELFCQPSVVKLNTLLLEEVVLLGVVEYLDSQHHEPRVVSACKTDVVQIVESGAELWADQRIGWGV